MDKSQFIKRLTLILEDFDQNKTADMEHYLDEIYSASEIFFADVIKEEQKKAVKAFLAENLRRL